MENMIYRYAGLLKKELDLFSPLTAYEGGAILGCNPQEQDSDPDRAFMRYVCRVGLDPAARRLQWEAGSMYNEISILLLGNSRSLINDFADLYRKCHGIISGRICDSFRCGYDTIARISLSDGEKSGSMQDTGEDTNNKEVL